MNIYSRNHNLILDGVNDFDIADILECGQCFHYECPGDHEYIVCAGEQYLFCYGRENGLGK